MGTKKNKRGFSGLSELASDTGDEDDGLSQEVSSLPSRPTEPATRPSAGNRTRDDVPGSPEGIEDVGSGNNGGSSGWKWLLGIIAVIFVIWLVSNGGPDTKKPSYNPPARQFYDSAPARSTLAREIENGKERAAEMESQISDMDNRLEEYERRMNSYLTSGMTDNYNMLVPYFNSLVSERNNLYERYSSLVDEVNSKVERYNSAYR